MIIQVHWNGKFFIQMISYLVTMTVTALHDIVNISNCLTFYVYSLVLSVIAPCCLVAGCRRFRETCCLHLQGTNVRPMQRHKADNNLNFVASSTANIGPCCTRAHEHIMLCVTDNNNNNNNLPDNLKLELKDKFDLNP
jgi:hypothetical protein